MRLDPTHRWANDRVQLFVLTPEDVSDAYVGWLNDAQVNRYLESRFTDHDRASVQAFVASVLASDNSLFLGVRDLELGRHVGNVKLGPIDWYHGLGEIGVMIGDRRAWGRGIATQAIGRIVDIATAELGLRKLAAGCYRQNVGSQRAFERAGFHVEAVRRRHFILDGQPEDLILLARFLVA